MPSTTRRELCRAVGAASLAGLAGCAAFRSEPSVTPRFGELTVSNHDTTEHVVHVVMLDDDTPVYWESRRATAAEPVQLGGAIFEGYPTDAGEYVLHAKLEDRPRTRWETFEFAEFDVTCLGLMLGIEAPTEDGTAELSIWKTSNPRVCAGTRSGSADSGG